MAEKLTDDEIRDLVMLMWSLPKDEHGVKYEAHTEMGQQALDIMHRIADALPAAVLILGIKKDAKVVPFKKMPKP